jgi:hypothetical protein
MRIRVTTAVAALLATGLAPLATTTLAAAAAAKYLDDFNGDGYRDLAIGNRGATIGEVKQAGAVAVVYGSARGLDFARRTVVSQNSPGIPGAAEAYDHFGADLVTRDMNNDGYADAVAATPGEDAGDYTGTITILWGSASGLTSGSAHHNPKHKNEGFAKDIAVGDFNADGRHDLVSVDDDHIWYLRGPFTKSGSHGAATNFDPIDGENISPNLVVAGKVTADFAVLGYDWDSDSNRVWFYKDGSSGPVKTKKVSLPPGTSLTDAGVTIADFDKNGYGDLTLGSPRAGGSAQGAVYILPGTSTGPSGSARTITQSTSGVPGGREAWDNFGSDVSAADTNGDGYLDLAIGVQGEVIGDSYFSSGGLTVLRGGPSGITGTGARWYDAGTSGIAGETTEDGWLGASVHLRDYNRDNRTELVASAPEAGRAYVLPGTSAGPTETGSVMLTHTSFDSTSLGILWGQLAD